MDQNLPLTWKTSTRSHGPLSIEQTQHADGESGWRAAVAGMLEILESTGGADRAGVCLAAARHASGLGPVAYDDPVDLSEYDIAYTKEDE